MRSVLQVCTYYKPLGGIESAILELVSGLRSKCQVEVLCTKQGPENEVSRQEGVKVTEVGSYLSVTGRPLAHQFPLELLRRPVDIMHYHVPFPLGTVSHMLVRPNTKLVATFHCDIVRYPGFKQLFEPIMDAFLDSCHAIIVTSKNQIDATPLLSRRRDKCHVIPFGVDASRFQRPRRDRISALRQKFGTKFVLFVGRLVYYKGVDVLIKAMKDVDAPLVVAGDGDLGSQLRAVAAEEGIADRIHFVGRVDNETLTDMYHACELFVLPSTSSAEAFGLVQVEAMLAGKPVINTSLDSGAPGVSLHGQTGLTVPPADPVALAAAINRLLTDDALRLQFGQQAKIRALSQFSSDRYVSDVLALYEKICPQGASAKVARAADIFKAYELEQSAI